MPAAGRHCRPADGATVPGRGCTPALARLAMAAAATWRCMVPSIAGKEAASRAGRLSAEDAGDPHGMLWWAAASGRAGGGPAGCSSWEAGWPAAAPAGAAAGPDSSLIMAMYCCRPGSRWPMPSSWRPSASGGSSPIARFRTRWYSCTEEGRACERAGSSSHQVRVPSGQRRKIKSCVWLAAAQVHELHT